MTTRRLSPRRRSRGFSVRKRTEWGTFDFAATLTIGSQAKMDLNVDMGFATRSMTVLRIIANLHIQPVAPGGYDWTFGLGTTETDSYVGGFLPDVDGANNNNYPWLWHGIQTHQTAGSVLQGENIPVDTKSRRRLPPDHVLFGIILNRSSSTSSLVFAFSGRALYQMN